MEFNRLSVALVLRGGKRAGTRARFKSSGMRDVDRRLAVVNGCGTDMRE